MSIIKSHCDGAGAVFQANRSTMQAQLTVLAEGFAAAARGGGEVYNGRHRAQNKLLPRERIDLLIDPGSYFLELAPLAGLAMPGEASGAGIVGGIGEIAGIPAMIVANEATVKGGALSEVGVLKLTRLAEIADQNQLPTIHLVESAGADLAVQSKVFLPGGREFRDISRRSRAKIPSVAVVFGTATAGGAYIPGMADYVIMVKDMARVFLAGPPLVKMATGEICDAEALGGATMHANVSGVADELALDEHDAIQKARAIFSHFRRLERPKVLGFAEPLYPAEDLLGIASADLRIPFDAREVIARIVDGSDFDEFKPRYGITLVTGFARIHGRQVGILGNNGVLMSDSAGKGAQFIQLCNQQDIPLVFLQNITGFIVGRSYEEQGIIRNGAKLINAVSNSTVPALTVMIGSSYGAGNYAMNGRAYAPRFLFTWPNHRIAVMGAKQLAGVMEIVKREAYAKQGKVPPEAEFAASRQAIEGQIERESDPFFATARLWDDGIIDPRDTRTILAIALAIACAHGTEGTMSYGVFRH